MPEAPSNVADLPLGQLLSWGVSAVLVPLWLHTAAAIARNGRDVAELRGRVKAIEQFHGELSSDIRNVHQRVGAVGRTTDTMAGQMSGIAKQLDALNASAALITEHLLKRDRKE